LRYAAQAVFFYVYTTMTTSTCVISAQSPRTQILPKGTIKRVHVDQHKIRSNKKHGARENVITIQWRGKSYKAAHVEILGKSKIIYSPDKALSCGAHVWVETRAPIYVRWSN